MPITFTSHVKHRLGNALLGSNDSMSVPDDFFFEKYDRRPPHADEIGEPTVYNSAMATAHFRLEHTWSVAKLQGWIWTVVIVVMCVLALMLSGVIAKWDAHEAEAQQAQVAAQAKQNAADLATQNRCLALTPDERKVDSSCAAAAANQVEQQKAYWTKFCAGLSDENRARSPYCNGTH